MDIDTLNQIAAENRKQMQEERELKNQILRISDTRKKQALWSLHFPVFVSDDSYLAGNVF